MLNRIIITIALLVSLAVNTTNAQVTYVHEDFMGSVVAESNVLGQITKRSHYEPYGEQRSSTISNEAAFTGHVFDDDLDLSYMGARYYDSSIGRFYSDDPVGFMSENPASFNRYVYANNNPFAYKDPNGELPVFLIPIIVFIAKEVAATAAESYIESKTGVAVPLSAKSVLKSGAKQLGKRAVSNGVQKNAASGTQKTYQTYTKPNPKTGEVYSGKTSGTGKPSDNVAKRDASHHRKDEGFGPAELDKTSSNKDAIRGREQELIDRNGGAQSTGGTSANKINGISDKNPKKEHYANQNRLTFSNSQTNKHNR